MDKYNPAWSDSTCYWMGVSGDTIDEDHTYDADSMEEIPDA